MFQSIQRKNQKVRALPYPYLGALSISNDIEYSSFEFFETLMKFLNTKHQTPLGAGLGLEVTSSLFFYSVHPYTFAYFSGSDARAKPSSVSQRIEDYLRAGWIDTNHAFGDFDRLGGFRREHALRSYEVLSRLGLRLRVFTNHGDSENKQNVGGDVPYHCGDVRGHPAYHADLMKGNGVQFVWTDSMVKSDRRGWITEARDRSRKKSLLGECVLQDRSLYQGFTRFRPMGAHAPNLSSLGYQAQKVDWERFYRDHGVLVLYQHLGVLHKNAEGCQPATLEAIASRPEVFLAPFYRLKREQEEGRLWIRGLGGLLQYVSMVESVEVRYDGPAGGYQISCDQAVEKPEEFFQGLTLYVEPTQRVRLCFGGIELSLLHNGRDETGQESVTVPWFRVEQIW